VENFDSLIDNLQPVPSPPVRSVDRRKMAIAAAHDAAHVVADLLCLGGHHLGALMVLTALGSSASSRTSRRIKNLKEVVQKQLRDK
jgi:hypothetical protein